MGVILVTPLPLIFKRESIFAKNLSRFLLAVGRSRQMNLLPYQQQHAEGIERALLNYRVALDASDPGTGKTYVACAVAARLRCPVVIVTTKATLPSWEKVARGFGITPMLVTNYERVRMGKLPACRKQGKGYVWNVPQDALLIFDEVQKCKGRTSQNAALLVAARSQHLRVLLCSATAAENPLEMRAIGFALGLHTYFNFYHWARQNGVVDGFFGLEFRGGADVMRSLHAQIFPQRGSRLRIADIPEFPDTQVEAAIIETGKAKAIQREYDTMRRELHRAEKSDDRAALRQLADAMNAKRANAMTLVTRSRQAIELYKVPAMCEMTRAAIEEGMSVVILVNFSETITALSKELECLDIIVGGQTAAERQAVIDRFQRNETNVVLANIQAGGVGVSLHDPTGQRPRLSIISPTFSAADLRQALGRVHRAGGAASVQKICFAAGTVEEHTAEVCADKLANIDLLNDGDLTPFPISTH